MASFADRTTKWSLRAFLVVLLLLLLGSLTAILLLRLGGLALLIAFLIASVLVHLLEPLLNAVAVYAFHHEIPLDFGVSRAIGSLCFAISSLALGYAAKYWGADSLIGICTACSIGLLFCVNLLPKMEPDGPAAQSGEAACSIPEFFRRYRRYTLVMIGFSFIAAFHIMTETYLLNMMERIGGDSSHVGVALLLSGVSEFCIIFFYERFRRRLTSAVWMAVSAVCFAAKALLFHLAPSVTVLYLAECLQIVTYGLYAPTSVYFANDEINPQDSVKGQSLTVAIFTLGGSLGSYAGGLIIDHFSTQAMTLIAFLLALLGACIAVPALLCGKQPRRRIVE